MNFQSVYRFNYYKYCEETIKVSLAFIFEQIQLLFVLYESFMQNRIYNLLSRIRELDEKHTPQLPILFLHFLSLQFIDINWPGNQLIFEIYFGSRKYLFNLSIETFICKLHISRTKHHILCLGNYGSTIALFVSIKKMMGRIEPYEIPFHLISAVNLMLMSFN